MVSEFKNMSRLGHATSHTTTNMTEHGMCAVSRRIRVVSFAGGVCWIRDLYTAQYVQGHIAHTCWNTTGHVWTLHIQEF